MLGMPATPSSVLTTPSCMTPGARERRVLLVQREHAAAQALVLERAAQHPGAHDRLAVVGEAERAGLAQPVHLGELLAAQPARDRAHEADGNARVARGGLAQRAEDRGRVDDRVGVRHRDDLAEAAGGRGARAGLEVLLVLLAGRAQVHVRVDEAREQLAARRPRRSRRRRAPRAFRARRSRRSARRGRARRAGRRGRRAGRARARARTSSSAGGAGARTSASGSSRCHAGCGSVTGSPARVEASTS